MQPSLTELQQFLNSNAQKADAIKADVEKAKALLASCEEKLNKLCGNESEPVAEPQPQKTLRECVRDVLNSANEPLTAKEIGEYVLESGYKTSSKKNFTNIVYQTLINGRHEFKRKTKPKVRPVRYAVE